MRHLWLILFLLPLLSSAGEKRALDFETFFTMKRVSNAAIAPDGSGVLYRIRQAQIGENNYRAWIYHINLSDGVVRLMTPEDQNAGSPTWRPDGKAFAYTSGGQVYVKHLDGSAAKKITNMKAGAGAPRWSWDGKHLLFVSTVKTKPDADHSGRVLDQLLFRHWNAWTDDHRSHVFMVPADGSKEPVDLTPGDFDTPPISLGSAHDYTFSPDGKHVAFVKNTDPMVAASTNNDIFEVDLETKKETRITTRKGSDFEPHYSPDGRYIAYVSMEREGFEADRHEVNLYDRKSGEHRRLEHGDHSADGLVWSADSKHIYYQARVHGARSLFRIDLKGGSERLTEETYDGNISIAGDTLVFERQTTTMPTEIFAMDLKSKAVTQITQANTKVLGELEMNDWESFWFDSENGAKVQGFVIKPPHFEAGKKYPMTYLIHGGPQGMWGNLWHYRWNAQMFAAPGQVVVLVNPHGSKGYGQKFCDAVSRDWGGLPYRDLMKGVEVALERFDYIDGAQLSAAGASYGGYMINWIAGHKHPFKALISHNGVFNMPSMAFATEELWFPEWEFGGTYMDNPELYEKWSPHHKAKDFFAPMLVIHSELDYRVPINQGIELFTAHQRRGITSQWLYFPDEDHFVNQPKNARMWWRTVHGWIKTHAVK